MIIKCIFALRHMAAIDIDGLGKKQVRAFSEAGMIRTPAHFFDLRATGG